MKTAGVLGAGLQGCCVALALARKGWSVRLYDRRPRLLAGASGNQEGKIHLGFVYAADPSLATARSMIEGALRFAPAVEEQIGGHVDWQPNLSRRFRCVIHRDSSLSLQEHVRHFEALQTIYQELVADPRASYLGRRPETIWQPESCLKNLDPDRVSNAFLTEETAVDPVFLHGIVRQAIHGADIQPMPDHQIQGVEAERGQLAVSGDSPAGAFSHPHDLVVNCLWEGRTAIDRAFGLPEDGPWITRIKYGFLLAADDQLTRQRSIVVTHGPFGDVVTYPGSGLVYASWYPACRVAFTEGTLASEWQKPLDGHHDSALVDRVLQATRDELEPFFPGLTRLQLTRVMAGTIVGRGGVGRGEVGRGHSDIDQRHSGLHRRVDEAPRRQGRYYSLFTGKYTLAPLQAQRLAAQVERDLGR